MNRRRSDTGFRLTIPAGLEILLLLTGLLFLAAVQVFLLQQRSFYEYEMKHTRSLIDRCIEIGTEQIHEEGMVAAKEGGSLDLGAVIDRINSIDLPSLREKNAAQSGDASTRFENAGIHVQYLILRGDGRALEIDGADASIRELDPDDPFLLYGRRSLQNSRMEQWMLKDDGKTTQEITSGSGSHREEYRLQVLPAECQIHFGEQTLLYRYEGAGVGIVGSADLSSIRVQTMQRSLKVTGRFFGVLWICTLLFCLLVHRSLALFRTIRGAMHTFTVGRLPSLEKLRTLFRLDRSLYRDEIKKLTDSFLLMSGRLEDYRDSVETLRNRYEPFIPGSLTAVFGKKELPEIVPGDAAACQGERFSVLFEPEAGAMEQPERRNRLYSAVCEIISGKGGIVTAFTEEGLEAVFPAGKAPGSGSSDPAGEAAALICALKTEETGVSDIQITRKPGTYRLRVIGHPLRMMIRTEAGSLPEGE